MDKICENDVAIKFKGSKKLCIGKKHGKLQYVTISPHDFIDLNLETGMFFVKNRFTFSKMKLIDSREDHYMDSFRAKALFKSLKNESNVQVYSREFGWV